MIQAVSRSEKNFVENIFFDEKGELLHDVERVRYLNDRKTVCIISKHDQRYVLVEGRNNMSLKQSHWWNDTKQRYNALLKTYKALYNRIMDMYSPGKPPYVFRFPKIYYYKHYADREVVVQEYIKDPVKEVYCITDLTHSFLRPPELTDKQYSAARSFLQDRWQAAQWLDRKTAGHHSAQHIKGAPVMIAKMPYGNAVILDDFTRVDYRDSDNTERKWSNVLCTLHENDGITIYPVDALLALHLEEASDSV